MSSTDYFKEQKANKFVFANFNKEKSVFKKNDGSVSDMSGVSHDLSKINYLKTSSVFESDVFSQSSKSTSCMSDDASHALYDRLADKFYGVPNFNRDLHWTNVHLADYGLTSEFLRQIKDIDTPLDLTTNSNALHLSAYFANLSMMKYCLQRGADPNRTIRGNLTALFWAIRNQRKSKIIREAMVKLLIEHGADINFKSTEGHTALHTALLLSQKRRNRHDMVNLLLSYEPDTNLRSKRGYTPLYAAISKGYYDLNIIENLLKRGSDPNYSADLGGNSLHVLSTNSHPTPKILEVSKLLIKYGASVNHQDHYGNTPLHYAVFNKSVALVQNFVENGVDVTIKNSDGKTALHWLHVFPKHDEMASILVSRLMFQALSSDFKKWPDFTEVFDASATLRRIKRECQMEIANIRSRKIGESSNFLNILIANTNEISKLARNEEIFSVLTRFRVTDYKHYGVQLKGKIDSAIRRRRLEDFFLDFMRSSTTFPMTCSQSISDFLSDSDLGKFRKDVLNDKHHENNTSQPIAKRAK